MSEGKKTTSVAKQGPTALALYEGPPFLAISEAGANFAEVLAENIGDAELDVFDLDRIKIPGSGGIAWNVTDENGEPDAVKEIEGVVLHHCRRRAYWDTGFDESGGGTPPDCASDDGRCGNGKIKGQPVNGRICRTCPMAQWGSAPGKEGKDSKGQACQERRMIFFLRAGDTFPVLISLPPTSIKIFTRFMMTGMKGSRLESVVKLKLEKDRSGDGIEYSKIKPEFGTMLPEADRPKMRALAEGLAPLFGQATAWEGEAAQAAQDAEFEVRD